MLLLAVTAIVVLLPAGATAAGGSISYSCSPAPSSCTGWYRVPVTVQFTVAPLPNNTLSNIQGCGTTTVSQDTTGQALSCSATATDQNGNTATLSANVTVTKDGTPPSINGVTVPAPDANGWHNHPFSISVNATDATSGLASCTSTSYAGPDTASGSFTPTCTDKAGNTATAAAVAFKYDATPPSVAVGLSRPPDSNGWYNHPVAFTAVGTDALSGIASCSGGTIGGGSSVASCTDNAGNTASVGVPAKYDATPPQIDGVGADRPPDHDGWYNHPVTITFHGSDGESGIASCTSVNYTGPDNADAVVTGSCVDAAGNQSSGQSFAMKYDATPPKLSNVAAAASDQLVSLQWSVSPDATDVELSRTPGDGTDPTAASVVYHGLGTGFDDTTVTNDVKYVYTLSAYDAAGNKASDTVTIIAGRALFTPAQGAVVRRAPQLTWRAVDDATYYNVQLFRGRTKILSVWPSKPRYRLPRSWTYRGRAVKLLPGKYDWYVWPGFGKAADKKYGPLLGHSSFVVR